MNQKVPESTIARAKAGIVSVIEKYVTLRKAGAEFEACCPFHEEKTPSFRVAPEKEFYYCFGCGASGDAIDFVMNFENVGFREAVRKVTGELPQGDAAPAKQKKAEEVDRWVPVVPVPDGIEQRPMEIMNRQINGNWVRLKAATRWEYRDANGNLMGYVYRFNLPGGGKDVVPQTYCVNTKTGEMSWRWLSFQVPRPIYGLDRLAAYPRAQVVVVEGEKAAEAAQQLFIGAGVQTDKVVVVSWPGGGKAIDKIDWSPLHGRSVGLWPDADSKNFPSNHARAGEQMPFLQQPGTQAMMAIHEKIKPHCPPVKFFVPPAGVPDGWDAADEFPSGLTILSHVKSSSMLADDVADRFAVPAEDPEPQPANDDLPPWDGESQFQPPFEYYEEPAGDGNPAEPPALMKPPIDDEFDELLNNGYFTVLGYDLSTYYVFSHEKRQVLDVKKSDFSDIGLIELAPANWWEEYFPGKNGVDRKAAANWFFRLANARGIYDPARVRGRGAWRDAGRNIYHHGDHLTVDGECVEITKIKSGYVYPTARSMTRPSEQPLTSEEGRHLLSVAEMVRWTMPVSAMLMTGWVMLAPICGALRWRPHIWITGAAGSGKSTIQRDFCAALTAGMSVYAQGNSTEAGIRQSLRADALPVLIDEMESNNEREKQRVENIMAMIRQSSSESQAKTLKGTVTGDSMNFHIRSMFCVASINTALTNKADVDRMTKLSIKPPADSGDGDDQWAKLKDELHKISTNEELPSRLLARALGMLPVIHHNIEVFTKVGARHFGTQRDGDQFGTLIAGAWSLISDKPVEEFEALHLLRKFDFNEHTEDHDQDDAQKALQAVLSAKIRMPGNIGELSVFELVRETSPHHRLGAVEQVVAEATLKRHGIISNVAGGFLLFSNTSPNLAKLVERTQFSTDLKGQLLRIPGAVRYQKLVSFNGDKARCVSIPLEPILGEISYMDDSPI